MLFNSFGYIFVFLPITLAVYFLLGRFQRHQAAMAWLVAASLFFYGWWNPVYLGLLIGSILFNFAFGTMLARRPGRDGRWLRVFGVAANLGFLEYFKYSNFSLENIGQLIGARQRFAHLSRFDLLAADPELHLPRADLSLKSAVRNNVMDVYLNNDTHWGRKWICAGGA